jgi:hypothetical protein
MTFTNKYDDLLSRPLDRMIDIRSDQRYRSLCEGALNYVTLALSTPGFEREISRHLAEKFNHNSTVYDRAIDSVYNQTHIGGPMLHHNLDGSHTWAGAIQTLRDNFPDESDFQHSLHATDHLMRDLTTPSGINPFLDPSDFRLAKDVLHESFRIPTSTVNDLLNINAAELLGASVATIALLLDFNTKQTDRLAGYFGRLGFSSYIAGNPALLLVTAICLGRVCYDLWKGESVGEAIEGMIGGGVSAVSFWFVAAQFSGPLFVGLAAGAVACYAVNWCYKKVGGLVRYDFDEVLSSQFSGYRSYYKLLT